MTDAVIVSTARTALGKSYRGALNNTHSVDMAGYVIEHAVKRAGIDPSLVEDVILGATFHEGAQGKNMARLAAVHRHCVAAGYQRKDPGHCCRWR